MSSGVGGFAVQQYALDPLLLRGQAAALSRQASHTRLGESESNANNFWAQAAQENSGSNQVLNPEMAAKAQMMQELGPQFQSVVESMRMKIQLSGEMGNIHNNWAKQAEFLVSAFSEGQSFIDNISAEFPDQNSMPPEIKNMIDEISRLQDSCITLLNSCLGTSFTKDEFRELIGAKKTGEGGGGEGGETGESGQTNGGGGGPQGDQQTGDTQGLSGGQNSAQDKLEETLRGLMGEARSLIAAAKSNPAMAAEFAGMAMQKIQEGMLIIDTIEALRKAMQGIEGGGGNNGILGNPTSGLEALGAMNLGGAKASGSNLGGGFSGGSSGSGSTGVSDLGSLQSMDASSEMGGAQQEAESMDNMRQELQKLAEEAIEAGARPDPKKSRAGGSQTSPVVSSVMFAPQVQSPGLFSGSSPTLAMQPVIA